MFVSVLVKKGLSLSFFRVDFSLYRTQAKILKFKDLLRSNLEKLKELHSEVFSKLNGG